MIGQPPPVQPNYGGGDQSRIAQMFLNARNRHSAWEQQNNGGLAGMAPGMAGFAALASGGQAPGFGAWKEKRMGMGLPFTGPQFR